MIALLALENYKASAASAYAVTVAAGDLTELIAAYERLANLRVLARKFHESEKEDI